MTEQKRTNPEQKQELFLPVHNHVELYPDELAIIDHPAFQRLRRVKQLGLAHMVFPGATHTRFEHSIGAVHVAQLIFEHVNSNHLKLEEDHRQWEKICINEPTSRFIRLAALLHDVGHLPLGHTLEDELNHLHSHDGPERLRRVAEVPFPNYEADQALVRTNEMPRGGWTLRALVDHLYKRHAKALELPDKSAFDILSHIVCKAPKKDGPEKVAWEAEASALNAHIPLSVCRDIVGDTICADFLDYIHRDWYHIGKPLYVDKRLYQYMEIRQPVQADNRDKQPCFVVNVGASEKIRHDALTDILVLLDARYRLAETVLFHRTKLALTGLLDRCLLEISDLYTQVGAGEEKFKESAESLLLDASDDGLPGVLKKLAAGADKSAKQRIEKAIAQETANIKEVVAPGPQQSLIPEEPSGRVAAQQKLILQLIDRFRDRKVYTLACKLRMADFTGPHKKNPRLNRLLELYGSPESRLDYLRKMEALCGIPEGSLVMNCPPDAAMNAKVAKVNLYIEDDVFPFDDYEANGLPNLTCGALTAQIARFYELWAASVYVDRSLWDALTEGERKNLKSVLKEFLFLVDASKDPNIVRAQMTPSLEMLQKKAARSGSIDVRLKAFRGTSFPSGLPFDQTGQK
jgi:HD superfamily phosphohydrolase